MQANLGKHRGVFTKKCPQTYPPRCLRQTAAKILKHHGRNVLGHLNGAFLEDVGAKMSLMANILG